MNTFKRIATGTLAALTLGITLAATSAPPKPSFGRNAPCSAVSQSRARSWRHRQRSRSSSYGGYYVSAGSCWTEKRAVYNSGRFRRLSRRIRVCN